MMVGTPHKVPYECEECGAHTQASTRSGECYSHNVPGLVPVRVCSMSRVIVLPAGALVHEDPYVLDPPPPPVVPRLESVRPRGDEEGLSVRAFRGGLPGLGRHR